MKINSILYKIKQKDEIFLNLVLDYVPETVYRVARHYSKSKQIIPIIYVKVSLFFVKSDNFIYALNYVLVMC